MKKAGRPSNAQLLSRQRAGSAGSLPEAFKRKREELEDQSRKEITENFLKSRRVGRSPPQETGKNKEQKESDSEEEGKMDGDKFEELMKAIKAINEKVESTNKGISEIRLSNKGIKKTNEGIIKANKEIKGELKELKEEWRKKQET